MVFANKISLMKIWVLKHVVIALSECKHNVRFVPNGKVGYLKNFAAAVLHCKQKVNFIVFCTGVYFTNLS